MCMYGAPHSRCRRIPSDVSVNTENVHYKCVFDVFVNYSVECHGYFFGPTLSKVIVQSFTAFLSFWFTIVQLNHLGTKRRV